LAKVTSGRTEVKSPLRSPLNMSVKGEYALQALLDLTTQPPGSPVKIAAIARRQKIPQKFLELILATLKQGGFVESRRGAEGGYLLARPPDQITVGEVLRFVQGTRTGKASTVRGEETPFTEMWRRVDRAVSGVLDNMSFAEISRTWQEKQAAYVPDWEI
jgi:Rrf2 family protein